MTSESRIKGETDEQGRPRFVRDGKSIARVIRWNEDGNPIVIYPGKEGGIRPGADPRFRTPYEYELTPKEWKPATAEHIQSRINQRISIDSKQSLGCWQDEITGRKCGHA